MNKERNTRKSINRLEKELYMVSIETKKKFREKVENNLNKPMTPDELDAYMRELLYIGSLIGTIDTQKDILSNKKILF